MKISQLLSASFPFSPTPGQKDAFLLLDKFFEKKPDGHFPEKNVFLLKGYAGTGKTTLVGQLVHALGKTDRSFVLMAPTGRAAKVLSSYAGTKACTIHRQIYISRSESGDNAPAFTRKKNMMGDTVFIVDEGSMISDEGEWGSSLLSDLLDYVFERKNNRLLIIGDTAQLPPVKQELSPALNADYLQRRYDVKVREHELREVVRQQLKSGILANATMIREQIASGTSDILFKTKGYKDIFSMTGEKLEDGLRYAYEKYGRENSVIICRSNRSAVLYNQYIRRQIDFSEDEISAGDIIMVVRNNYLVLEEDSEAGFLANGDFAEVQKIRKYEEAHGFRFATLELKLLDYPAQPAFEAKVLLDTLHSHSPSLPPEDHKKLYNSVLEGYLDISSKRERYAAMKKDPYLNALLIKFAYALTCHKSQGGQWNAVFLEQGIREETISREYLRWLYTGVTRATDELYLLNFNPVFFNPLSSQMLTY